jgi:hypothetical protein
MSEQQSLFDLVADAARPDRLKFPLDWPYHGSSTGQRLGCRCGRCREAKRAADRASAARAGVPRICKRCGEEYVYLPNSGGGTKYCQECKQKAYREAVDRHYVPAAKVPCCKCGEPMLSAI